jgi:two-component system LytT family response regulator
MNVVVIDDEKLARENIKSKIKTHFPSFNIVSEADSYETGITEIMRTQPDIIFLDVAMPGKSGLDLLRDIGKIFFEVVFITAYNEYAIRAFDYSAVGYVMKPIENSFFVNTVQRAIENVQSKKEKENYRFLLTNMKKSKDEIETIVISSTSSYIFIAVKDILFIKAEGRYVEIFLEDGCTHTSSNNISFYSEMLPNDVFIDVHKSYIINKRFVKKYDKEGILHLQNDHKIPVARRRRNLLLAGLKINN